MRFMKSLASSLGLLTASLFLIGCGGSGEGGGAADTIQAGKFTVLGTRTDNIDPSMAKANAENTLVRFPDINAMVGLWEYNAPACLEATEAAGRDDVKIFSFDEAEVTLQAIVDGKMEGTIVQQPYEFGYQSAKYLKDIIDGKEVAIPENKEIEVAAKTITKANIDTHWAGLKELQRIGEMAKNAPAPQTDTKVAFVINNPNPFWEYARAGCYKGQLDFGIGVEFIAPATGQPAEQNRILEDILSKGGYAGVALSPLDPANQSDIINQVADAIPLICHDSDAPDSKRRFYLGTNNYEAGRMLGRLVKERMPEGGKIMVFVGVLDVLNAQQRREGLIDELKES
jgi:ribose transport system substrate-binding protein